MRKALVRLWREFNSEPLIGNSVTLTVIIILLMGAAMMAVIWAAMACISYGFNDRAIDAFLAGWPLLAVLVGTGGLWLTFFHAGINPDLAFDAIFKFIGAVAVIAVIVIAGRILLLVTS